MREDPLLPRNATGECDHQVAASQEHAANSTAVLPRKHQRIMATPGIPALRQPRPVFPLVDTPRGAVLEAPYESRQFMEIEHHPDRCTGVGPGGGSYGRS